MPYNEAKFLFSINVPIKKKVKSIVLFKRLNLKEHIDIDCLAYFIYI